MPLPVTIAPGRARSLARHRPAIVATVLPAYWLDPTYDSRVSASAINSTGLPLHDQIVSVAVPSGVDADSLRVVETTIEMGIDRPFAHRYGQLLNINRLPFLPCSLSGTTMTFKVLGLWANGIGRTWDIYWDSTSAVAPTTYTHLGGNRQGWTAALTAGTTGDTYRLVINGTNYTHVMTAGQTAAQIGTALGGLINAGTDATSTGTSTLTIKQVNGINATFTVANTGSTVPGNIVVTKPLFFGLARIGPDTEVFTATQFLAGLPYSIGGTAALYPGWGLAESRIVRTMAYEINPATSHNANSGALTSITDKNHALDIVGSLGFTAAQWTATYTDTYSHKIMAGRKSDDTGPGTLNKYVDVHHIVLTYVCATAYTPVATTAGQTSQGSLRILALADLDTGFGGNGTIAVGNQMANWSAHMGTGAASTYAANANLSALSTSGVHAVGASSSSHTMALLVNSVGLANFGSQSPTAYWSSQGNAYAILGLRNLVNTTTIPIGATITIDFWIINGTTNNPNTTGDVLLVDEAITLLQGLGASAPSVTPTTAESYSAARLAATVKSASSEVVNGIQWFKDNALAYTGLANNTAYMKELVTGLYSNTNTGDGTSDEADGNYGEAHKLHGLCLRYLRLHEPTILTQIERQVQFHIDIETAAVAAYGSWWSGSAPYWWYPSTTPSGSFYPTEGGTNSGDVDPAFPGGILAPISYSQGQVRRSTSIDQMHMVAHGLYAYRYLLRNESAVIANTTLWANALSLIGRMATFESTKPAWSAAARICGNLHRICQGLTPTVNNGISDTLLNTNSAAPLANPFHGNFWGQWQVSNSSVIAVDVSANITLDSFFRAVFSNDSVVSGVRRYLQGQAKDFMSLDPGYHEFLTTQTTFGKVDGWYPKGWGGRGAASGNDLLYNASRPGDKHYYQINNGGVRDLLGGRHTQRIACMCLAALFDPTFTITIENNSAGTPIRTANIKTVVDEEIATLCNYMIEPTSRAVRWSVPGYQGASNPRLVDSAFTGYTMMALELWLLVNSGASYATYYPIGTW